MKEVNQGMARSIKSSKEIKRLTEERDQALQEYTLVMSERDSVHREQEKLTDDLTQSRKQIKTVEVQNKELMDKVQGRRAFCVYLFLEKKLCSPQKKISYEFFHAILLGIVQHLVRLIEDFLIIEFKL